MTLGSSFAFSTCFLNTITDLILHLLVLLSLILYLNNRIPFNTFYVLILHPWLFQRGVRPGEWQLSCFLLSLS